MTASQVTRRDVIRVATSDDAVLLLDIEKQASTAALSHVFGPDIPFPDGDVLARWRLVLEEPGITTLLDVEGDDPVGYAAFGDGWLRHFAVVPALWGSGHATVLHRRAAAMLSAEGTTTAYLWVLVDNFRGRAFYKRHGWVDTGVRDVEVFPPYPVKMKLRRTPPSQ